MTSLPVAPGQNGWQRERLRREAGEDRGTGSRRGRCAQRSEYAFLATQRRSVGTTIVEHHPWSAALESVDHPLDARDGCLLHGLQCQAQLAIAAAVRAGYDPFG